MNYKKVIEDFNNGTIDPLKYEIVMDNDGGYWSCIDCTIDDDTRDDLATEMSKKYGDPEGYQDLVKVLKASGVTTSWC